MAAGNEATDASIESLPACLLEEIAGSVAAVLGARLVSPAWRDAFGSCQAGLRLYARGPASEAAALCAAPQPPFPSACRATLVLAAAESVTANSQEQLDAWLHALQQRPLITQLTLTSAGHTQQLPLKDRPRRPFSMVALRHPSLARLASLRHLRTLILDADLDMAWCHGAAAVVAQLGALTRLTAAAPHSDAAASALAQSLTSRGLPHLAVLDICFEEAVDHVGAATTALLHAAATCAPSLTQLTLRGGSDAPALMRHALSLLSLALATAPASAGAPAASSLSLRCTSSTGAVRSLQTCCRRGSDAGRSAGDGGGSGAGGNGRNGSSFGTGTTASLCIEITAEHDSGINSSHVYKSAIAATLQHSGLAASVAVEGLVLLNRRWAASGLWRPDGAMAGLDLSALPPSMSSLGVGCPAPRAGPSISGRAAALTSLQLHLPCSAGAAFAALDAGCPNLRSLELQGGVSGGCAGLEGLTRLAHLCLKCGRSDLHHDTFPAAWLPASLVTLRLQGVRLLPPTDAQPAPDLGRLTSLSLEFSTVHLGALRGARALRRLTFLSSWLGASELRELKDELLRVGGQEALPPFSFPDLEELRDMEAPRQQREHPVPTELRGRNGAVLRMLLATVSAAVPAAAAAASPGGNEGGADAPHRPGGSESSVLAGCGGSSGGGSGGSSVAMLLPRLQRLSMGLRDVLHVMVTMPHLLRQLPLRELHITPPPPCGDMSLQRSLDQVGRLFGVEVQMVGGDEVGACVKLIQAALPHCEVLL